MTAFSWNLVTDLRAMWAIPFMRSAFEGGTIIATIAGIIGYFVILRRSAFASHALGHVGFSGAAAAVLYGINPVYGLLAFTAGGGTGMALLGRKATNRDIEIGTVLAFMLGLGFLFISLYHGYADQVYSILFGEILAIIPADLWLSFYALLGVVGVLALVYRPLLFASLDEDVAEAKGLSMTGLGLVFMLLLAVSISMAVQVVGVLLVFALTVTPAAIAVRLTNRPLLAIVGSVGFSVAFTWLGLFIAFYQAQVPVSFFITLFAFATYVAVRGSQALWALPWRRSQAAGGA